MNYVQPIRDVELLDSVKKYLREQSERNYMLFVLGINTGLRISDILSLRKIDVYEKEHIIIKEKKTKKKKWLPITKRLRRELKRYCEDMNDDDFLFTSRQGVKQPIGRSMAYKLLKEAAENSGISNVGTHTLRKTFGYHFYQKTKDVAILQNIFNHSSPEITLRYIGINQDTMDDALKDFHL